MQAFHPVGNNLRGTAALVFYTSGLDRLLRNPCQSQKVDQVTNQCLLIACCTLVPNLVSQDTRDLGYLVKTSQAQVTASKVSPF